MRKYVGCDDVEDDYTNLENRVLRLEKELGLNKDGTRAKNVR